MKFRNQTIQVRHGGIPDDLFETTLSKKNAETDFNQVLKTIDGRIKQNEAEAEKRGQLSLRRSL